MKEPYETPEMRELGKLEDLTQQLYNKIGTSSDIFTALENGQVVGSLVPAK